MTINFYFFNATLLRIELTDRNVCPTGLLKNLNEKLNSQVEIIFSRIISKFINFFQTELSNQCLL